MTVRMYSRKALHPRAILGMQGHLIRKDSKVTKNQWRASSDGPDMMDVTLAMWEFDHDFKTSTAMFVEPVMSRGGGTAYICVSVRPRPDAVEVQPALALVQAYWPESEGRPFAAYVYYLVSRAQETASTKLMQRKLLPEG